MPTATLEELSNQRRSKDRRRRRNERDSLSSTCCRDSGTKERKI